MLSLLRQKLYMQFKLGILSILTLTGASTLYGYDIGFKVSKAMTMVYKNRMTYKTDASGHVVSVPIMQIETQMKF